MPKIQILINRPSIIFVSYIHRCLLFLETFGPVIAEDFVFAEENKKGIVVKSGYTPTVDSGDGDYLTSDTMWDFKVSRSKLTSKQTLQLLMYYIMGKIPVWIFTRT